MKFQVRLTVSTQKAGLQLLDEYDRLGFAEEHRGDRFGYKFLNVRVSQEFAKAHKALFDDIGTYELHVDLSRTEPGDWESWGSAGVVLAAQNFNESRLINLL
jgi:hypothetical protein